MSLNLCYISIYYLRFNLLKDNLFLAKFPQIFLSPDLVVTCLNIQLIPQLGSTCQHWPFILFFQEHFIPLAITITTIYIFLPPLWPFPLRVV